MLYHFSGRYYAAAFETERSLVRSLGVAFHKTYFLPYAGRQSRILGESGHNKQILAHEECLVLGAECLIFYIGKEEGLHHGQAGIVGVVEASIKVG